MEQSRTRRLAAVWFADIVGYAALSTHDEDAALAVVTRVLSRSAICTVVEGEAGEGDMLRAVA